MNLFRDARLITQSRTPHIIDTQSLIEFRSEKKTVQQKKNLSKTNKVHCKAFEKLICIRDKDHTHTSAKQNTP